MSASISQLPIAVLGAGPVGLAAAAKLIERGLPFFILEAGKVRGKPLAVPVTASRRGCCA